MNGFAKNIITTFSSRFFSAVFAFCSTIIIARAFGPAGKGIFTMVAFFPTLALNFGHLGLGNANTYLISQDKEKTKNSFYNSFWYGLIIGSLFIITFALFYRLFPHELLGQGNIGTRYFLFSLFVIPFMLWENFYQGIFVGRQEFKLFNIINILSKVLLFCGLIVLIFILKWEMYFSIIYYLCLMMFPAFVYSVYFLKHYGFPFKFNKQIFSLGINFGIRSYLACLLAFLIFRSDIYLINLFLGLKETGLYSLSTGFGDALLLIASSVSLVLFPKITENQERGLAMTLKVSRIISFIIGSIIIFGLIFGGWFIPLVFGESFRASLPAFYVLLFAIYFWSIINFLGQFFASKGYPWFAIWIWLPGLILNILLNIIFIPKYGIIAAALTSLTAYLLIFILHFVYIQKYNKISFWQIFIPNKLEILDLKQKIRNKI
jgi:O-antigen/teichoic acid export membrane protein